MKIEMSLAISFLYPRLLRGPCKCSCWIFMERGCRGRGQHWLGVVVSYKQMNQIHINYVYYESWLGYSSVTWYGPGSAPLTIPDITIHLKQSRVQCISWNLECKLFIVLSLLRTGPHGNLIWNWDVADASKGYKRLSMVPARQKDFLRVLTCYHKITLSWPNKNANTVLTRTYAFSVGKVDM